MGRVSTCQKNCNTIDLRRAQVNDFKIFDLSLNGNPYTRYIDSGPGHLAYSTNPI